MGVHRVFGADSSRTVSANDRFHLNHYQIQSLEYFQTVKMTRGTASGVKREGFKDMDYYRNYDAPCTVPNHILADLVASGKIK